MLKLSNVSGIAGTVMGVALSMGVVFHPGDSKVITGQLPTKFVADSKVCIGNDRTLVLGNLKPKLKPTRYIVSSRGGLRRTIRFTEEDVMLIARVIYAAAAGQPMEGKIAVGAVIVNRAKAYNLPIKSIVYGYKQFSEIYSPLFKQNPPKECIEAARQSLYGVDTSKGATHFVNLDKSNPNWAKIFKLVAHIGNHWFYRNQSLQFN